MNIRILHSIASIDTSYGGPVAVVKGLCNGLNKLGIKQTIITSSMGDIKRDEENARAFPNVDIVWVNPFIRRYYFVPLLKYIIKSDLMGVDLCHVHGVFNGISNTVCRSARKLRIPYILEPFGTLSPYCLAKSNFIKRICLFLGESKNIHNADAVKFSSDGELKRFNLNFKASYPFVAANGLDWNEFRYLPEPGRFRELIGIDKKEIVLFFLGRLQPIKGLEIFIPAFLQWLKSKPAKIRLVIAGHDEAGYRKNLECLAVSLGAGDAILFTGPLYGQDRIQAMVDSNIIVLPSFHENFGIAAAEGMACGKPVFISDQVDIWPEVKKFDLGEVTSLSNENIIIALDEILQRNREWDAIGQRGRKWAEEHCDWGRISEIILAEYTKIISFREGDTK
jgi:glycosyltransferase involved in cell wall biosynthesis